MGRPTTHKALIREDFVIKELADPRAEKHDQGGVCMRGNRQALRQHEQRSRHRDEEWPVMW